jgi:hypothetical protein
VSSVNDRSGVPNDSAQFSILSSSVGQLRGAASHSVLKNFIAIFSGPHELKSKAAVTN